MVQMYYRINRDEEIPFCKFYTSALFGIELVLYNFGLCVYQLWLASIAIDLSIRYESAVDAPATAYNLVKNTAYICLTAALVGMLVNIVSIVWSIVVRKLQVLVNGGISAYLLTVLLPVAWCSYITYRLHRINDAERNSWNAVNPSFLDVMNHARTFMMIALIPGAVWVTAAVIVYFIRRRL
jgi:hypothetical protein